METQNVLDIPAAGDGKKKTSPVLLGCGLGCGVLLLVTAVLLFWSYKKIEKLSIATGKFTEAAAEDLGANGYAPLPDADIRGKNLDGLFKLMEQEMIINEPTTGKVYAIGGKLTVNAPCAHDIMFISVGGECEINRPVNASVCFLGMGKITIAAGAKVQKLYVARETQIDNRGEIGEILHDFNGFYDFRNLDKLVKENGDELNEFYQWITQKFEVK